MPDVFLCYSRANSAAVAALAEDIRELGYHPWFDRELSGGQEWWNQILGRIRTCDVFVLALSGHSLESEACKREYTYASELGRPILPVLVERGLSYNLLPPALSTIQFVDYTESDRNAGLRLARAFSAVPAPGPLPEPLPPNPAVPISYLGGLTERIQAERELTFAEQTSLLVEVRRALGDPDTRGDALILAAKFRKRRDLLAVIADDLDELLGGWPNHSGTGRGRSASDKGLTHRPLGLSGSGTTDARGLVSGPTEQKALILQVLLGAGLFIVAPESRRRWIYPIALLAGLWGLSLAPNGLDIDLGGQFDAALDGPASFFAVVGGVAYAAGIADLLLSLSRRKHP
jgi:hypothetical protein